MKIEAWSWDPRSLGKLIGIVTSGARASIVPVRISRDMIETVHDEMLVIVEDHIENRRYLGALKSSMKLDIAIDKTILPTTFDPEKSRHYSAPMMTTYVEIFGEITNNGELELSFAIPRPGSYVYRVDHGDKLASILKIPRGLVVGKHKFSGLEIHLDPRALDFHIAVLGATGTGKSRLVKALVEEIYAKTRYSVVIFDHTGIDYADPNRWNGFQLDIIDASRIVLEPNVIAEAIIERADIPSTLEEHVYYIVYRYVEDQVKQLIPTNRRGSTQRVGEDPEQIISQYMDLCRKGLFKWDYQQFMNLMGKYLSEIGAKETTKTKLKMLISLYAGKRFFEEYLAQRDVVLKDLVEKLLNKEKKLLIIDMSREVERSAKRYIVFQTLRTLWDSIGSMTRRAEVVAVIDEAHNYACYHGCRPSSIEIERTAREGRKWGFGLILASQRIIDLAPDVRGNINTVFFSRLQTQGDYQELKNWIEGVQYLEYTLPRLATREFYVAGLANPFKRPLLMRVREVA